MKTKYYIVNNIYCKCPLRRYIGDCEYFWSPTSNKWYNVGISSVWRDEPKKKITKEEAFSYMLEN